MNKGPASKRYIPMARGRSRPIDKSTSHISVRLGVDVLEKGKGSVDTAKEVKKSEEKKIVLEAEEGAPTAHIPGNPAKQVASESSAPSDDPHAGGSHDKQSGGKFTQHRQGSRGE